MSLLETAQQKSADPQLIESQIKDRVREIVRAYRHSWDVYSELIQNSIDAINRRYRILNDPDFYLYDDFRRRFPRLESDPNYRGRIKITINVPKRQIEIRDNGGGIEADRIEEFLLPEGTDKRIGQEYGFKGFGLTYVAFVSDELYLASRSFLPDSAQVHEFGLRGLFDWLADESTSTPFPDEPIANTRPVQEDLDDEWNTVIRVTLANDYSTRFPAISSAEEAVKLADSVERLRGFEYVLRTRTAIGNTRALFNEAPVVPIDVELDVIFPEGDSAQISIPYRYYHPKEHDEVAANAYEFRDYVERLKLAGFNRNFRGLYHTITGVNVGERRPIRCDFAIAAISSTRLSNIEADLELDEFGSGDVGISYGVYLAIDGMPTGLRIDDWDRKGGYLKRYFAIVDAEMDMSNQLDPGRKGISRYYAQMISDKVIELMNTSTVEGSDSFAKYASRHLDHGRGRENGGLVPQDFSEKIRQVLQQCKQQQEHDRELLLKLRRASALNCFPMDEQEVIALFYELLSKYIIKGYRTVYLAGSRAAYDAAFEYEIACSPDNIHPNDPLGIGRVLVQDLRNRGESIYQHSAHYEGLTYRPELCVDFKQSVGGFLYEIILQSGRSAKDPRMIDLLVTWDVDIPPSIPAEAYTIDPVVDNRRIFHSTTHRLGLAREYSTEIQCIVLKEVLTRL